MNRAARRQHLTSAGGVVLLHALLGYALVTGLNFRSTGTVADRLTIFRIVEPPPPPEEPMPAPRTDSAAEGRPSPPNLKARPVEIVAPAQVPLTPTPVLAAPIPATGPDPSAGASDQAGPGTGSGGTGVGSGGGGAGSGSGAGAGRPARLIRGRIVNADYPRAALRERVGGTVLAHVSVDASGRVSRCVIARSSGHAELDETTCRLVQRRFRFDPARDAEGRPVPARVGWRQDWWLESGRRPADLDPPGRDPTG